ncbi:MAG: sulfatase [Myxococcota bacterium]
MSLDTLRQDSLGCYGYSRPTSPNIDAFSKDCVVFDESIAQAPSTKPSHASIFTSLNVRTHGTFPGFDYVLSDKHLAMAEILAAEGYRTASYNGGGNVKSHFGFAQGFQIYDSTSPDRFIDAVNLATDWLDLNGTDPFFLFLHTYEVHHPYTPAPEFAQLFDSDYSGQLPPAISIELLRKINSKKQAVDDADRQHIRNLYDAEIRSMDAAFATFIEFLKASGKYDESLIIVTSDHGEEFGERGAEGWHSHTLYDELLHVPLLIKFPQSRFKGTRVEGMVRGIDILPTIIDVLGLPEVNRMEGISLVPMIGGEDPGDLMAFSTFGENLTCAVRTKRWKLYGSQLYDLQADPGETTNVAGKHPRVAKKLMKYLQRHVQVSARYRTELSSPDQQLIDELKALGYAE